MAETDKRLLACPFCGGPAEIYTGRFFPSAGKNFHTEAAAREWLAKNVQPNSRDFGVRLNKASERYGQQKYFRGAWHAWYDRPAYVPRCMETQCADRSAVMYRTEQEAIDAWNRRAE